MAEGRDGKIDTSVRVWNYGRDTSKEVAMADQDAIDSLASKFQAWAEALSPAEQTALGEWLAELAGADVSAHWGSNWWQQPGAWSQAWTDSWKS